MTYCFNIDVEKNHHLKNIHDKLYDKKIKNKKFWLRFSIDINRAILKQSQLIFKNPTKRNVELLCEFYKLVGDFFSKLLHAPNLSDDQLEEESKWIFHQIDDFKP